MLEKLGLLDQFGSIFARTLDYLGGFLGDVAQNMVDPERCPEKFVLNFSSYQKDSFLRQCPCDAGQY
jgi:hypothetical protein